MKIHIWQSVGAESFFAELLEWASTNGHDVEYVDWKYFPEDAMVLVNIYQMTDLIEVGKDSRRLGEILANRPLVVWHHPDEAFYNVWDAQVWSWISALLQQEVRDELESALCPKQLTLPKTMVQELENAPQELTGRMLKGERLSLGEIPALPKEFKEHIEECSGCNSRADIVLDVLRSMALERARIEAFAMTLSSSLGGISHHRHDEPRG